MIKEYKPFTEETLDDALSVVRERFPRSAEVVVRKVLRNPLRSIDSDAGIVGYRDGKPVCFQAHMIRRLYFGQAEVFGGVGGLTCKVNKGCPLSVMLETIDRACYRANEQLLFGNSCCAATAEMDEGTGSFPGPATCSRSLWRPIRFWDCLWYVVRRKIFKMPIPDWPKGDLGTGRNFESRMGDLCVKREGQITPDFFDALMADYLTTNRGLVSSRSAEEIEWMYGDKLRDDRALLLCARRNGRPTGYIMVGSDHCLRRWVILDWFAVRNDLRCLEELLKSTCRFLRRYTPAFMIETRGFPSFVQPVLKKYLSFTQQRGNNYFSWYVLPQYERECRAVADSAESWFFGPYDGDLHM